MPQFLIAIAILIGGYWLIRTFGQLQPAQSRLFSRKLMGGAAIGLSGFFALRGATQIAVPLFLAGLGLIGSSSNFAQNFRWRERKTGQKSTVSTMILTMELDHDTGTMAGTVLKGPFEGRGVSELSAEELKILHRTCVDARDQSAPLLEAWLDRNHADWRESWTGARTNESKASSAMTAEEALAVLGLKAGASADDVRRAHRKLMKDFHPDLGGSDYLAAKINQAKELLLHD
jgi:hypothetical protein